MEDDRPPTEVPYVPKQGRPAEMATTPGPDAVALLRRGLLAFFDARARDLPWRGTDDAYQIWVSEVMLQQTRVETVIPYWMAWLERFPTVEALAEADEDEVFRLWEGLGYYRRARHLRAAARMVVDRHGGRLPGTAAELRGLPGIGAYTSGAIASIAFGEPVPAVDGNVRRVLARLFDRPSPTASELETRAGALVDPDRPGDFNQALMELGATVCTPRSPRCDECPVESFCLARARGTVAERPAPPKRRAVPSVAYGVAVLVSRSSDEGGWRAAVVRRPDDGMLAGLREFPAEVRAPGEESRAAAVRAAGSVGVAVDGGQEGQEMEPVRHVYSHLKATYHPVLFRVAEGRGAAAAEAETHEDAAVDAEARGAATAEAEPRGAAAVEWMDPAALGHEALPRAQRRIADALAARMDGAAERVTEGTDGTSHGTDGTSHGTDGTSHGTSHETSPDASPGTSPRPAGGVSPSA